MASSFKRLWKTAARCRGAASWPSPAGSAFRSPRRSPLPESQVRLPERDLRGPAGLQGGRPTTYAVGSTTVLIDKRVVINHDPNGFYANQLDLHPPGLHPPLLRRRHQRPGQCRHLDLQGSRYRPGRRPGPTRRSPASSARATAAATSATPSTLRAAPRPMDRVHVEVAPDGKLLIGPLR